MTEPSNVRSTIAHFGRTPKALLRDPDVAPAAKAIYASLDEVNCREYVTIKILARWMGCSDAVIRKHLAQLAIAGWVQVIPQYDRVGRQTASRYVTRGAAHLDVEVDPPWPAPDEG